MQFKPVPSRSLNEALDFVRKGGRLVIATATSVTWIDKKVLARFEKVGAVLLKEDGEGYRIARGRTFDYLFSGNLQYAIEE